MCSEFIHLRTQSSYSLLESALKVQDIVTLAKAQNMPAVCLSDRGNLFGSLEFALAATNNRVQPINGIILKIPYLDKPQCIQDFVEILLIAKDEVGYKNLLKLVSYTFTKNDRGICNHLLIEDLKAHSDGIIMLSGYTDGPIGKALLNKSIDHAYNLAKIFQGIFHNRFYFEIMRHNLEHENIIESAYLNIALELAIPLVATNKVLFKDQDMHYAHDVLSCIAQGVVKENENRVVTSDHCYFKTAIQMQELFHDLPSAIENTAYIAQRCSVMSQASAPMLPSFRTNDNTSEVELLIQEAEKGLNIKLESKYKNENIIDEKLKFKIKQEYFDRLHYELNVICRMNFAGYFLIVSDFIKWSKQQNIAVGPGRGSGAGSIVAWCLLITDLDPIKFGLLFERFLNPDRVSMPDFDIDFCQERREEVINYVRYKYGNERVGHIITFGTLQAKAAIKDVARVLELPYQYANYLTELVPFNAVSPISLKQAIDEVPELGMALRGEGLYNFSDNAALVKQVLIVALSLEGLHRHASVHAAGIIISSKDLVDVIPVCKDENSDSLIVQYSMKYAELTGLMKFDFLGLQTLTVISKCKELLMKRDIHLDFDSITFDDQKTFQMLSQGRSTGIFQFESIGMKDVLRKLKPDCIGDIIALGALYRPGPMENIPTYIACKHGKKEPDYLHPLLESILKSTYGVIIYQEQVLEIAKVFAGYTLAAADLLRRAMGKKIKSEMQVQEQLFIDGAKANGIDQQQAKFIFSKVEKFAGYGFNKAHASAYGLISYQTAYLKANFLAEFLVTCLNLDIDNHNKINLFIQEAKCGNINIVPPDINLSLGSFSINYISDSDTEIVYAIGAIRNASVAFGDVVVDERIKNGNFKDIIDFIERINPKLINSKLLENIIKAGCFDSLHQNRNQLLHSVDKLIAYASTYYHERISQQLTLLSVESNSKIQLANVSDISDAEKAFNEFEVFGLFMCYHPLSRYESILSTCRIKNSLDLSDYYSEGQIKIAGVIQKKDSRMSARGRFITLQLSDQYGIFDITIFSDEVLKNYVHLINVGTAVVVCCDYDRNVRLIAKEFYTLDEITENVVEDLILYPKNTDELSQIIQLLNHKDGVRNCKVSIKIMWPVNEYFAAKIDLREHHTISADNTEKLRNFI